MTTENQNQTISESSTPWLPTAVRFGLYGGLVFIVFSLVSNLFDLAIPTSLMGVFGQLLLLLLIAGVIAFWTMLHHRQKELGGFMSFKRAFLVGFVSLFIAGLISGVFQWIYINFIDPDFVDRALDGVEEMLANFEMPEAEVEKQLKETEERFTTAGMAKQTLIVGPIIYAFFCAILGAVLKKSSPFK